MKSRYILALATCFLVLNLSGSQPKRIRTESAINFNRFPTEIIAHICSYLLKSGSLEERRDNVAAVYCVCQKLNAVLKNRWHYVSLSTLDKLRVAILEGNLTLVQKYFAELKKADKNRLDICYAKDVNGNSIVDYARACTSKEVFEYIKERASGSIEIDFKKPLPVLDEAKWQLFHLSKAETDRSVGYAVKKGNLHLPGFPCITWLVSYDKNKGHYNFKESIYNTDNNDYGLPRACRTQEGLKKLFSDIQKYFETFSRQFGVKDIP